MTVTAEINIESPTGRRLVKELEKHKKVVKLSYPKPQEDENNTGKTYTFEEFEQNLFEEFKKRYGVDIQDV
ncbi:MAG: hypothetical protein WCJ03_03720 [Bacteroidales bacterium]